MFFTSVLTEQQSTDGARTAYITRTSHTFKSCTAMLHELLLALSGHPSPLLSPLIAKTNGGAFQHLLSPAELALLRSLARDLGEKHKSIRDRATAISSKHDSTVCRAVATAVVSTHLARFQRRILEVERDILEGNPNIVGAYNVVPLSGLVGAFDGWTRKLEWLWSLVQFIQPSEETGETLTGQTSFMASRVIERLRESTFTGYPDIEQLSLELVKVAETAWLKQISAWVLYGRFPAFGGADFFITRDKRRDKPGVLIYSYGINSTLIPSFVTKSTANSILFIGKSLNHIRDRDSLTTYSSPKGISPDLALLPEHLAHLSSLTSPITSASLSAAIGAIRLSLSRNALQKLLPMSKVLELLRVLRDFFLLERGEFAIALLSAADERLSARRNRSMERTGKKGLDDLSNILIKEGEVSAVLARTWATLESLQSTNGDEEEEVDADLDLAREFLKLSIKSASADSPAHGKGQTNLAASATTFDDLLFPTSTALSIRVPSPLDLFLAPSDVDIYSSIHSYLLSIRRAHLRLSKLFTLSVLRRDHPSPKASSHSDHHARFKILARMRQRADHRVKGMRPIWAIAGHAAFLLAELGEYFQGEVVKSSSEDFLAWLQPTAHENDPSELVSSPSLNMSVSSTGTNLRLENTSTPSSLHDPESLASAHRTFLLSLIHSLLLDDAPFTNKLKAFMASIDHLSAIMNRLNAVQQNLDLETDVGVVDTFANYAVEEQEIQRQLRDSRSAIAAGVEGLVQALRDIDNARAAGGRHQRDIHFVENDEFVPKTGGGVDRLLLKIDYTRAPD